MPARIPPAGLPVPIHAWDEDEVTLAPTRLTKVVRADGRGGLPPSASASWLW